MVDFLNIVSTPGPVLSRSRLGLAKLVTRLTRLRTRLVKARARSLTIYESNHKIHNCIVSFSYVNVICLSKSDLKPELNQIKHVGGVLESS